MSSPNPFSDIPEKKDIDFSPALRTIENLGRVYPFIEAAGNLATAPVGMAVGGIAGLGAMATNAMGLTNSDPSKVISNVAETMTYKPKTEEGRFITDTINYPFEKLAEISKLAGDKTLEVTGSPTAATVAEVIVSLGPFAALPMSKKMATKIKKDEQYASEQLIVKPTEEGQFISPKQTESPFSDLPEARKFLDSDLDGVSVPDKAININLNKIESSDDVKQALYEVGEVYKADINEARRGVVSHDETIKLANQLGLTTEQLLSRRKGVAYNAHEALAARRMLVDSAESLMALKEKAKSGSYEDILSFQRQWDLHRTIQEQVSGLTAEAGRALNQYKIIAKSEKERVKAIQTLIDSKGGREKIEDIINKLDDIETTQGLNKFVEEGSKATTSDMLLEAWINALLSGPQTHAVNMTSNSLVAMWTIPEHLLASGIGKLHGGEKVYVRETLGKLYGMVEGTKEGLRAGTKTFLTGEPTDPITKIEASKYKAIPGPIGSVVRTPGRALMAEDELFKAIGYRMELNALAMRQGLSEGLKGKELARRIQEIKNAPPEDIHLAAIEVSHYQTFTKKLGQSGAAIQAFSNSHPSAKLIIPFVRTPINILKFAGERSPLAFASKEIRADIKAGGVKRDLALSRIAIGSTIGATIASLAAEGFITGGGPSNPDARKLYYASGRQPYSIKVGDKWYSYSRLEPLGMILGVSADYSEIVGQVDDKTAEEIAALTVMSISKNLVSKTWLKGVSDLIEVIQDPDRYGSKWLQGYAGTLIPTGVAQYARVNDPVLRRTDDMLTKIKSRLPGYSEDLLPRLNVWGEPIILQGGLGPDMVSPVYISYQRNDKTTEEMLRLDVNISQPDKKISGVELTPEQHNELIKLTGRNVKIVLDRFTKSSSYDSIPDGIKSVTLTSIINGVRGRSMDVFLSKHPDLIRKIELKKVEKLTQ